MIIGDAAALDLDQKAQVFAEAIARLATALQIEPTDFVAMLGWIHETAVQALDECHCGHCTPSQNATKH